MTRKDTGDPAHTAGQGGPDSGQAELTSGKFPVARPTERMVRAVEDYFGAALLEGGTLALPLSDWEQRLALHDRLSANVIALCRDGIVSQTLAGKICGWNKAAEDLFQISAETALGQSFDILVPEPQRAAFQELLAAVARGETCEAFEMTRLGQDGTSVEVAATLSPIANTEGRVVGVSLVARDITKLKRRVAELAQANARLEEKERALEFHAKELARSNRALEEFAYVASHDLQEPLRTVASFAQLLADEFQGKLGAAADQYIYFAIDGAKRMQRLIDDLLEYSRVGIGQAPTGPVDCGKLLASVMVSLRLHIEEVRPIITIHELPQVWANGSQLELAFRNLISNSIKFRGATQLRVDVSAKRVGADWEFSVCDNGSGFEQADAERIFEMFQRLGQGRQRPGSGIGLAIVKKVIESQGGKVWAQGKRDQGACFYFTLPHH